MLSWVKNFSNQKNSLGTENLDQIYSDCLASGKKLILCVTVGRSGTRWLSDIFSAHENIKSSVEKHNIEESFYRYVKFYKLDIDLKGVLDLIRASIIEDWKNHDISLYTTPYLSHDLLNLCRILRPDRIIWGVNDPEFTVTSFYNKGWYKEEPVAYAPERIPGLQPNKAPHHSFGRVIPVGNFYSEWKKLSRVGKISWFYNEINMGIYHAIRKLPKEKWFVFKLEEADQNYQYYLNLAKEFNLHPTLKEGEFLKIKGETVKKEDNLKRKWSKQETEEFNSFTNDFHEIYKRL